MHQVGINTLIENLHYGVLHQSQDVANPVQDGSLQGTLACTERRDFCLCSMPRRGRLIDYSIARPAHLLTRVSCIICPVDEVLRCAVPRAQLVMTARRCLCFAHERLQF